MSAPGCESKRWMVGGDVDRDDCAPVESCVDGNVSAAARGIWQKRASGLADHVLVCMSKGLQSAGRNGSRVHRQSTWPCCSMRGPPDFVGFRFRSPARYDSLLDMPWLADMAYNNSLYGNSLQPACREGCLIAIRRQDMQKSHPTTTLGLFTHTPRCFLFQSHVRLLYRADPSDNRLLRLVDSSCSLTRPSQTSNLYAAKGDAKE